MLVRLSALAFLSLVAASTFAANGPSFDCSKATARRRRRAGERT